MFKKILAVIMVSCLVPVIVHAAWSLNTRNYTTGGSIQVGAAPPQTTTTSVFKSYTTSNPVTIKVTPNPGYIVSQVNYNNVIITNPTETSFMVQGPLSQKFFAWYAAFDSNINLSASVAGVGGSVDPPSVPLVYGATLTTPIVVTYTPISSSYKVGTISGIPSGASQNPAVPVSGQPVTVTLPIGFTTTANVNLTATFIFTDPVAEAGVSQMAYVGKRVILDGTGSYPGDVGISSYVWVQVSGPVVTLLNANTAQASFDATIEGDYTFSLTIMPGGSTDTTVVRATSDSLQTVRTQCNDCHTSINNARAIDAFNKWSVTKHQTYAVVCSTCHVGAGTGGHPGIVYENNCISCHSSNQGVSPAITVGHMGIVDTYKTTCYECHKHDLVAVSPALTCTSCHGNPPATQQIHTTGFVKYSHVSATCSNCHNAPPTTDPTPTHRNGAVEVLTNANACSSCHSYPPVSPAHATAVAGDAPNCSTCHVYNFFTDATHNNGATDFTNQACSACHGHPPTAFTLARSGKTGPHPVSSDCAMCHPYVPTNPSELGTHNNGTVEVLTSGAPPHFNNSTSAGYSASYVTSKVTSCAFCHVANDSVNLAIRQQWATSGHANTEAAPAKITDFKTLSPCARCHTTTGFIAYSSANMITQWGLATDKTKEVITCVACHSDVVNGVVRTMTPNKPYESDQTFTNANVGKSNVCMDCHGGRNNGSYIQSQVGTTDFTNYPFQYKAHFMVAGGIMQGMSGFNFPGRTYSMFSENSHSRIGMGSMGTGDSGPCAGCHMSSPTKHKFSVATEVSGTITALETNVCVNCHNSSLPAATLDAKRVAFNTALEVLRIQLADKGYFWDATVKTFYRDVPNAIVATNWGVGQNGANVMGAAMNYKMFVTEPSAYAHNPAYAKELIADSIDAVFNGGVVTGSIDTALADLQSKNKITAGQITAINAYKQADASCNSCHGNPPATATHNGIAAGTCTNCHIFSGAGGATHNNGSIDLQTGTAACSSCHGFPPVVQTIHTTGLVKYNHDKVAIDYTNCSQCHSQPASPSPTVTHLNGSVDLLTTVNACNSCHSAPPASGVHSAATLAPFNCTDCHSYTTSSATTHNNGTVDFSNLQCNTCHGYPPMSQAQLDARVAGTFTAAKLEDYANGGGHHATHLLPSLTANEAFTPCLPCHPNASSGFHSQGGSTIVKANVNVFEAADMNFRFDETRSKRYEVATQSCSNVSCHFQPTVSW